MQQSAQFPILWVLEDLSWRNRRQDIFALPFGWMRRYMIDIDPLVAAARR